MSHGDWKDMFRAVQENDIELVIYYINEGIDVNYQHPEYMTGPLIECIRCGHLDLLKVLLEHGALPDRKEDFTSQTPLQIAQKSKNIEAVRIIQYYLKSE